MNIHVPFYHRYLHLGDELFFNWSRLRKERITPNLFIIGAQKCGTSSLHNYLNEHPDIFMSTPIKEPGYYVDWSVMKSYYDKKNMPFNNRGSMLSRGMLRGYRGESIIGESSTFYTNGHRNIPKDAWTSNDMKLESIRMIYLVRHPLDRIRSHYLHYCRNQGFYGDINDFVRTNEEAIEICRYGKQLSWYAQYLDRKQIHVASFESLVTTPQSVVADVYEFLDLPPHQHERFGAYNTAPTNQKALRDAAVYSPDIITLIEDEMTIDKRVLANLAPDLNIDWSYR